MKEAVPYLMFDGNCAPAIGAGGKVTMKPTETFWGAYFAMLDDQFGVDCMFNYDLPQKK